VPKRLTPHFLQPDFLGVSAVPLLNARQMSEWLPAKIWLPWTFMVRLRFRPSTAGGPGSATWENAP